MKVEKVSWIIGKARSILDAEVNVRSDSVTCCYHSTDGTVKPERHGWDEAALLGQTRPLVLCAMRHGKPWKSSNLPSPDHSVRPLAPKPGRDM